MAALLDAELERLPVDDRRQRRAGAVLGSGMSTRRVKLVVSLSVVVLLGAACGSDGARADRDATGTSPSSDPTGGATTSPSTSATPPGTAPAFPVTIPHKFGETVITEAPERIAVVGLTEQDALLALGVAPVAVTDWFGDHAYAAWPWARPLLDGAQPVVLDDTDGVPFEQVAASRPDLIVGLYAGLTAEDYKTLSAIAPTVAQPAEYVDWGIPWQEQTLTIGSIVGQRERAEELVAEVEEKFARARAEHPELAGARAAVATPYEGIFVYGPEDVRGRFLSALGLQMPDDLVALATDEFGFELSLEQVELLDVDVIVWLDTEDVAGVLTTGPYANLAVHTEGREVLLDSEAADGLGGAMSFVTVLSLPYLLEGVIPMFAAALDGDLSTSAAA